MSDFVLAPAAIVRASAWPREALEDIDAPFPDAHLSDVAYREAIDRARDALWSRTAGDARFMKALLFSSPSLVARVRLLADRRAERSKRVRHAETSLYRYLSRAASRTTPSGLWAGVALARFGDEEKIISRAPKYAIAPDLAPFATALRALADRTPYKGRATWRVNPTLERTSSGFRMLARAHEGSPRTHEMPKNVALSYFLDAREEKRRGTLGELAGNAGVDRADIDALVDLGALVGGLSLSAWFTSPWSALAASGEALVRGDRAAWTETVKHLADLAADLETRLDELRPSEVAARLDHARDHVRVMLAALGVDAEVPRVALRCDLGLPFEIVLGPERRVQIEAALDRYHREWVNDASPATAPRAERRRAWARALASNGARVGSFLPEEVASPDDPRRLRALSASNDAKVESIDDVSAPWGAMVARVGSASISRVFGIDDNPATAFARHASLFGESHALTDWMRDAIATLADRHGITTCDLVVPYDANPNVLARAEVGATKLEPWGTSGADLLDAELRAEGDAIVLHVPGAPRASVLAMSAAFVEGDDALAEQLLFTGFQERAGMGTTMETIGDDDTARALAGRGRARFEAITTMAKERRWSSRVTVAIDHAAPLAIGSLSPLAWEAALEGAGDARVIEIASDDSEAWLAGRFIGDVVAPLCRKKHAFSKLKR